MSITLINNPVTTESGITYNLFAGFEEVNFGFKREDAQVNGVGLGIDNNLLIQTQSDLSNYLNEGDFVYIFSTGLTHTYDDVGEVIAITSSTITISVDFIENTTSGYINFYRNYFLECQLVNVNNSAVKILPLNLTDDGDNAGNIDIDVSIANDLNEQMLGEFSSGAMQESRVVFKLQYREVWDENQESSYTLIDDEIILVYATEQMLVETFVNELDNPTFYRGYNYGVVLAHSKQNNEDTGIGVTYDELDINKIIINSGNPLVTLDASQDGFLFASINKNINLTNDTEYLQLNAEYRGLNFFDPAFFNNNFFDS